MENKPDHPTPGSDSSTPSSQPVAYDTHGRPLYLHPADANSPSSAPAPAPIAQYVHVSRSRDPEAEPISPEIQALHDRSMERFPQLNLSEGEYILTSVQRHPIGIVGIWLIAFGLIGSLFAVLVGIQFNGAAGVGTGTITAGALGLVILAVLILIGALIASYIYNQNRFYLTNESVIQEIMVSLFSKNEQTVSLANIEDASYRQDGLLAHMFNFGTIRLSTEGDETTYRFSYVTNPKRHIAILNNAVEAFKNGRPVGLPDEDDNRRQPQS